MSTNPKRKGEDTPLDIFFQVVSIGLWVFGIWVVSLIIWPHQ